MHQFLDFNAMPNMSYGKSFQIRPIQTNDVDRMIRMHQQASRSSLYMRYLRHHMPERDELTELCNLPHQEAKGLVAVANTSAFPIIGTAHYVIDSDNPQNAEPAILVEDTVQLRGVGAALFLTLVELAKEDGVNAFEATISGNNRAIVAMLKKCNLDFSTEYAYGMVDIKITLPQVNVLPANTKINQLPTTHKFLPAS